MANNFMSERKDADSIYKEMIASFVSANGGKKLPKSTEQLCRKVYNACCEFLNRSGLMIGGNDLSRADVVSMEAIMTDSGDIQESQIDEVITEAGVRPVINLKADVEWVSGTGTSTSPYKIK